MVHATPTAPNRTDSDEHWTTNCSRITEYCICSKVNSMGQHLHPPCTSCCPYIANCSVDRQHARAAAKARPSPFGHVECAHSLQRDAFGMDYGLLPIVVASDSLQRQC